VILFRKSFFMLFTRKTCQPLLVSALLSLIYPGQLMAADNSNKSTPPAPVSESQLNQVTLSNEAIKKLGLTTTLVMVARQTPALNFPAQAILAPEALAAYSTPMSGYVVPSPSTPLHIGSQIKAGQILFTIHPVVTPEARLTLITSLADAEGQLQAAEKQLSAHTLTLGRAKQLWLQHVGSQRAVDDAQANVAIADTNVRTAKQKRELLKQAVEQGSAGSYPIKAAITGVVSNLYFSAGQLLVAGAKLVDIVQQDRLWVTAYVPHAQVAQLNLKADAVLAESNARAVLKPISSPQGSDALTGTRKLLYAMSSPGEVVPMQRLTVQIPQRGQAQTRASVPCSATLVDIYGNTWVYVQQDETHFARQLVFVTQSGKQGCLLSDQRLAGKAVVTQGTQELFAVETGYTH
jgi:membrane fusion protein, heavy metal efflux system